MKLIVLLIVLLLNYITGNNGQTLKVSDVRFAQTHVIPVEGKQWVIKNKTITLQLIGNRDALLLVKIDRDVLDIISRYTVSVWSRNNSFLGELQLNDPSKLPPTESNDEKYSNEHYSVKLDRSWVWPGMKIQFSGLFKKSEYIYPNVGENINLKLWTLPLYLFGANDTNTFPFSITKGINDTIASDFAQRYACSTFEAKNHPLSRIDWPYLIMPQRNGNSAYKIVNSSQQKDGYAIMSNVLTLLSVIRNAFGESSTSVNTYVSILQLDDKGKYADTWGGLASIGGSRASGDHKYRGTFIHEVGHALGNPHSGESYAAGNNPYLQGSLNGSEWGFDFNHMEFLSNTIASTCAEKKGCEKHSVLDSRGRCFKQSLMQGGNGHYSKGYIYGMFQDFEMANMQNNFVNKINYDESTGKYYKWNQTSLMHYDYKPVTTDKGLYGLDNLTPIIRNVKTYTIVFTHSWVGPSELTQIYPWLYSSKGNILRQFDPSVKTQVADIIPNTGTFPWYCHGSGCDLTIRVTYEDNSIYHVLINQGKRKYWNPNRPVFKDGLNDPKSSDSFITGAINVSAEKKIIKVDLLDTPEGWVFNSNSTVLASRSI